MTTEKKRKPKPKRQNLDTHQNLDAQNNQNTPIIRKPLGKTKLDLRRRAKIAANAILAGKTQTEALIEAGYSKSYARFTRNGMMQNPAIRKTFSKILDEAGLTDDYLSKRIKELSEAKETKFFQHEGIVTDKRVIPALSIQSEMLQFATRLKGHLVDRQEIDMGSGMMSLIAARMRAEGDERQKIDGSEEKEEVKLLPPPVSKEND